MIESAHEYIQTPPIPAGRPPSDIISYTVWLYYRFNLSHRDIEYLLAERGITVSYETIRLWCIKFGAIYTRRLKRRHRGYGDTFYIDEVYVKINGKQHCLWRAVDQDGEVVDVFLQAKRDGATAKRFFKRLLRSNGGEPRKIVTDKLRSYGVAHRELIPEAIHSTQQYENNRAEQSHEATRVRERGMRKFKSTKQAQRFLGAHAAVSNLFNLGRHLVRAKHYRELRVSAFAQWERAVVRNTEAGFSWLQEVNMSLVPAQEFALMVEAGMPPMEAIVSATKNAADLLGESDQMGSVSIGKYADVVAVKGNPIEDITLLENIGFVMKNGKVYKAE